MLHGAVRCLMITGKDLEASDLSYSRHSLNFPREAEVQVAKAAGMRGIEPTP